MDEILVGQLPRVPRRRGGRAARPGRRRRGLGDRPLPAREPRAQAHGVRVADRLRRLAADAGRRSARGGADGRLQRRDGRADRPLPAAARPVDLRRRPRRPGDGPAGPRAADRARLDPRPTTPSPATSPGSPRVDRAAVRAELGFDAGRAGLRGGGRRVRRRRPAAAARRRGAPVRGEARAGPADGRRHRAADRPRVGARRRRASRSGGTCPACTGCSPPATSRSSRAG